MPPYSIHFTNSALLSSVADSTYLKLLGVRVYDDFPLLVHHTRDCSHEISHRQARVVERQRGSVHCTGQPLQSTSQLVGPTLQQSYSSELGLNQN